jgi:hemerythrin-like domain-containing protein
MSASKGPFTEQDFEQFRLVHRAMGREVDAIRRMAAAMAPLDRMRPKRMRDWMRFVERTFHHHHTVEDRWFFPMLAKKDPTFADALAKLDAEHIELDPLLKTTCDCLDALSTVPDSEWEARRAELITVSTRFCEVLEHHLEHEENEVVPRAMAHLDREDMDGFNRRAMRAIPIQDTRLILPWLLESLSPDERERAIARMPLSMRLVFKLLWAPRFKRYAQSLHA